MMVVKSLTVAAVNTVLLFLLQSTSFISDLEKDAASVPDNKFKDLSMVYGTYFIVFSVVCISACLLFKQFRAMRDD
jgi:hypothetical protein